VKTENLFWPESLIHILEQITMPHFSANKDGIYVTSIKHAHAPTARGTRRLEEFWHQEKADRADSSSCRDSGSCLTPNLLPVILVLQKGNSFTEREMQVQG